MKTILMRTLIIALILILVIASYYILSIISTNGIYNYIKKVITEEVIINDNSDPLSYFSNDKGISGSSYSQFDIRRQYVFHNFKSGIMSIVFSEDVFNEDGKLVHQYKNINVLLYIEKQNGEWVVTDLKRMV